MSWKITRRWCLSALAAVVCASTVSLAAPAATATGARGAHAAFAAAVASPGARTDAQGARAAEAAPPVSRDEVIERAKSWLTANNGGPVPYSQTARWSDGYRQDCSGYVSMALKLPTPGPNTVALKNDGWTQQIPMDQLAPGDLVIKADHDSADYRHVVIFDGWTDGDHTAYDSYEQAGDVGTRHARHDYGLHGGDGYFAYHPVNLVD